MKNWLKKPYFFIESPKFNLILCFGIGFFIFIFLYLFQPFGFSKIDNNKLLYSLGFGLVSFVIQSFFFLLLPYIFKTIFNDENWTVGKNIVFLFLLILCITFGNWYYNSLVQNTNSIALISLKDFFIYTFSISIFPIVLFTYISERLYTIRRERASLEIMKYKHSIENKVTYKEVILYAENKKDFISFNLNNLIYITSQSNYASFFVKTEKGIKEIIIRNTLTKIAEELKGFTSIKRCHKSYIIHTKFMDSISGNARGYFLESELLSIKIPISRNLKKDEIKRLIR
mgnify:CR=1 FL=1